MADSNEQSWWRRSRFVAFVALVIGAAPTLWLLILPFPDLGSPFGLPLSTFMMTIVAPVIAILAILWFADRQGRLDRLHGYYED
jgi:putative solute:sodium symporter small subunit